MPGSSLSTGRLGDVARFVRRFLPAETRTNPTTTAFSAASHSNARVRG